MRVAEQWALDPGIVFLNHASFGACPRDVLAAQQAWRDRMEAEPVAFLARELGDLLDEVRTFRGWNAATMSAMMSR
jgi:isopenicillin-N epimerase